MRKRSLQIALLGLCLQVASLSWPHAHAQNKPPDKQPDKAQDKQQKEDDTTLKITTELIEIRAVVTDKAGNAISGLTKDDFELIENNKPQELSFFSFTRVPGKDENTAAAPAPSAVLNNAAAAKPARSIVLFADNVHIQPGNLLFMKQALRKFIDDKLGDTDLTALVTSFGTLGLGEQFTRDRRLLRYATERLSVGPGERQSYFTPYLAGLVEHDDPSGLNEGIRLIREEDGVMETDRRILIQLAKARAMEVLGMAAYRAQNTLYTLRAVIDRLAQMPGQRLLVLFSDGFTLRDNTGRQDSSLLQTVTSRAARSGVVIYSIDARGLAGPPGFSAASRTQPDYSIASAGEHDLEDGLNALAADTGGKFFHNTNDLAGAAKQALDDNQVYYTLAYYPAEEGNENKFRKLTVRVKGHPEYRIRTQKGYLPSALARSKKEAAKTPDEQLVQRMVEPLPVTEIGVTATANDIEGIEDAAQVSLSISVDGQSITTQAVNDRQQMELKIVTLAYDKQGQLAFNEAQTVTADLRPESYARLRAGGYHHHKRLSLKPGFYQIRVGVFEPKTNRTGTASALVQVPDLKSKKLTLSSLILAGGQADPSPAQNQDGHQAANAPAAPGLKLVQGIPFFRPNQALLFFYRVYQNALQTTRLEELEMQTEIWERDKAVVTNDWLPLTSRLTGQDERGPTIGGQLLMRNFTEGLYELRLKVRVKGKKDVVQRMAVFGVEK